MARNRTISPDFWTWEAVIDCAPMTRLLFIGLWNFADDFGVLPLRPRTVRMQVFPGDDIDGDQVRAMIDELAARQLVRIYEVEGVEYLAVVDWARHHRVGKRARRRFPPDDSKPLQGSLSPGSSAAPDPRGEQEDEPQRWRGMIKGVMHDYWPRHARIAAMDDAAADRWTAKWIAEGCDYGRDIVPAVRDFYVMTPFGGPPAGFQDFDAAVARNRARGAAITAARPRAVPAELLGELN